MPVRLMEAVQAAWTPAHTRHSGAGRRGRGSPPRRLPVPARALPLGSEGPAHVAPDWLFPPRSSIPIGYWGPGRGRVLRGRTVAVFAVLAELKGRAFLPGRRCEEEPHGVLGAGGPGSLTASRLPPDSSFPRSRPPAPGAGGQSPAVCAGSAHQRLRMGDRGGGA